MRVVIFADTFPPDINGIATSTYNLFKTLNDHGIETLAVIPDFRCPKVTFKDNVIRLPGLEMKKFYSYTASFFWSSKAFKILKDFKPDIVHIQNDAPVGQFGYLVASRLKIATVYTYHTCLEDYSYYVTKGMIDRLAKGIIRGYTKFQSLRSYEFIAPSQKIKDYLRAIGIDDHISVVPTGIEFDKFSRSHENKEESKQLKKKWGIAPDDYVLLSLGRVAKEKSIDVCIDGFAKYMEENPHAKVKFLIVGGGPALPELKEQAKNLKMDGKIIFTDRVDPSLSQKYYWLGDCFISASLTETQGLTFMEAMAARAVIMARYDDNLVETIIEGKTGFFFEDANDFVSVFDKVINLPKEKREEVLNNAELANEPYSMERFYENIKEVYERAIKKYW